MEKIWASKRETNGVIDADINLGYCNLDKNDVLQFFLNIFLGEIAMLC